MTNQETGSPVLIPVGTLRSYGAAADEPDRSLGADRLRVGEDVEDLDRAGDALLVAAREAPQRHLGRDPVAEVMRRAEPQGGTAAEPHRVERCEQQSRRLEVVGRIQSDLCAEIA